MPCRSASSWPTSPSTGTPPRRPAVVSGLIAILILLVNIGNASIFLVVTSVSIILVYIAYLLVTVPTFIKRRAGWPEDQGRTGLFTLGRPWGVVVNLVAIAYGALMVLNLIWPRQAIYGVGKSWGGVISVGAVLVVGLAYYYGVQRGKAATIAEEHRVQVPSAGAEPHHMVDLPARAQVVVIGGGIIGTSVAYHLTALGHTDLVLLEQGSLSGGTTWHAAGLVGQMRSTENGTRLVQYSADLYSRLEAETGLATGFKRCGGVTVARTPERMTQLRRTVATAEAFDLECELIGPGRAKELYPILETEDLLGAIWLPGDGTANPTDVTQSLARGARQRGAVIAEKTRVTGILTRGGTVTGVQTDRGDIEADIVVNCAGQWAKAVGAMCGVIVPLHSAEHFYVVTEQIEGVHRMLPILRDPDGYTYFKEEVGGLVVGGFEPQAKPWVAPDQLPYPFEFQLLDEDWDHFSVLMESALHRIPALHHTGVKKFYNGPESFTPDNQFILGEAPELRGFFVAAGFNSVGIATAGGAGRALAEWIVGGEPTSDVSSMDIRRFADSTATTVGCTTGSVRCSGCTTRCRGRAASWSRRGRSAGPPSITSSPGRARLRLQDGLGTAQRLRAHRGRAGDRLLLGQARLAGLVGGRAGRCRGTPSRSSTRPRSARSWSRAATPSRSSSGCAPRTSLCLLVGSFTPAC